MSIPMNRVTGLIQSAFLVGALATLAPSAAALDVTLATSSIVGAGSIDPSGQPIDVANGDRIRYALIVDNPNVELVELLHTTIFYDPAQLALVSSYGAPLILLETGFGPASLLLVSPPGLKEGVPGELIAIAAATPGGTIGLGPDLAATLEFEVLDATNPVDVIHGVGVGDPDSTCVCGTPALPTFLVPEPTGALPFALLTLFTFNTRRPTPIRPPVVK